MSSYPGDRMDSEFSPQRDAISPWWTGYPQQHANSNRCAEVIVIDDDVSSDDVEADDSSYHCRYCDKYFSLSYFKNRQQFGAHCSNCSRHRKLRSDEALSCASLITTTSFSSPKPKSTRLRRHRVKQQQQRYQNVSTPTLLIQTHHSNATVDVFPENMELGTGAPTVCRPSGVSRRCMNPGPGYNCLRPVSLLSESGARINNVDGCASPLYRESTPSSCAGMNEQQQVHNILYGPKHSTPSSMVSPVCMSIDSLLSAEPIFTNLPPEHRVSEPRAMMAYSNATGNIRKNNNSQPSSLWECLLTVVVAEKGKK